MFEDRKDAGQKLAEALDAYREQNPLVLAIPRGGVEVAYHVAKRLGAEFSILVARKLPFPDNPEAGFGAVAEDGSTFILDYAARHLSPHTVEEIKKEQTFEIKRRIETLRKGEPLPQIIGKTVILVDDGIAMGSTMRAGILLCRDRKAKEIVVASPVASSSTAAAFEKIADGVVILEKPRLFRAVAQVYVNWYDVSDEEVIGIMESWEGKRGNGG
ncbi:MAG: phosphoribosyltransferase [Planctomycetota bacterium]|jgi:putative phosphoribosyl transferase